MALLSNLMNRILNPSPTKSTVAPTGYFEFDEFDKNGKKRLKICKMSVSNMVGANSDIAQTALEQIKVGEQVLLEANLKGKENSSVKVKNTAGVQIGWLKNGQNLEDHKYRYDIFERLENGTTVLARVCSKEQLKNGKTTIQIDVARYAK